MAEVTLLFTTAKPCREQSERNLPAMAAGAGFEPTHQEFPLGLNLRSNRFLRHCQILPGTIEYGFTSTTKYPYPFTTAKPCPYGGGDSITNLLDQAELFHRSCEAGHRTHITNTIDKPFPDLHIQCFHNTKFWLC
jgi:hypothetical protein